MHLKFVRKLFHLVCEHFVGVAIHFTANTIGTKGIKLFFVKGFVLAIVFIHTADHMGTAELRAMLSEKIQFFSFFLK